jgi:hypothetical protein
MIEPHAYVFKCVRPTATLIAYPTVLDAPHSVASICNGTRQAGRMIQVERGQETPTVNERQNRVFTGSGREVQVAELKRIVSVRYSGVGSRDWELGEFPCADQPLSSGIGRCCHEERGDQGPRGAF